MATKEELLNLALKYQREDRTGSKEYKMTAHHLKEKYGITLPITIDEYLKTKNTFFIKDDDQSVYKFRLAAFKDKVLVHIDYISCTFEDTSCRTKEMFEEFDCQYVDVDIIDKITKD